jgi:hypothetical protein
VSAVGSGRSRQIASSEELTLTVAPRYLVIPTVLLGVTIISHLGAMRTIWSIPFKGGSRQMSAPQVAGPSALLRDSEAMSHTAMAHPLCRTLFYSYRVLVKFTTIVSALCYTHLASLSILCTIKMADQHVTIEVLPNEVLLHVFLCHRPVAMHHYDRFPMSHRWEWHVLAHVC